MVAIIGVLAGAIAFHDAHNPSRVDRRLLSWTRGTFGHGFLHGLLNITSPVGVTLLVAAIAVVAYLRHHSRLALAVAAGPMLAFVLTEHVLKPLVGRTIPRIAQFPQLGTTLAYPSGHETGLASLTTVLVLVVCAVSRSMVWRLAALATAVVVDLLGCLALVGNIYHYATDTFAGIGVAVASIVGVALLIDRRRVSSPSAGTPASRARAA